MNRLLAIGAAFVLLAGPALAQDQLSSFAKAKKFLADLHQEIDHLKTIYCGCPYARTTASGGDIDRDACGLKARKNEKRSDRVEWEHVVPASWFGNTRACWQLKNTIYPACTKSNGKSLTGRKCCEKVNAAFMVPNTDPNNLFPSGGEVNGDRSNLPYGEVAGEPRDYGTCDFEIRNKVAEPATAVRGELARAMLYMAGTYGVDVRLPLETVLEWSKNDPAESWEIERARLIAERTGLRNTWVLGE